MVLSKPKSPRSPGVDTRPDRPEPPAGEAATDADYRLDEQIGFLLRKANQRHLAIFTAEIPEVTPRQFAALAKLLERGPLSQNRLGRATAMDAATIKGVIGRLQDRGLVTTTPDPDDRRRLLVALTEAGRAFAEDCQARARRITATTLAPLSSGEARQLLTMIRKLT